MEFPYLGEHCALTECKKLDFLPFECNICKLVFCKDHFQYDKHSCKNASEYDHQVPICPLCNSPVSFKYGDLPDVNMNKHIDQDCSIKKNENKIYKNKCSMANCKDKEIIELICNGCKQNYCLKHRHATDHMCSKKYQNQNSASTKRTEISNSGNAAMQRMMNNGLNKTTNFVQKISNIVTNTQNNTLTNQSRINQNRLKSVQGNLNEDEALAIVIQQSFNEQQQTASSSMVNQGTRESPIILDEDDELQRAIELSKREYERNKDKCLLC